MSTATEAIPSPTKPFQMPQACLGQAVIWYKNGDKGNPYPAMVARTRPWTLQSLDLIVFEFGVTTYKSISGVKHISDPGWNPDTDLAKGRWDHTDQYAELREAQKRAAVKFKEMAEALFKEMAENRKK